MVAVLIVWGIVGYRIYSSLNPDVPEITNQDIAFTFNPKKSVEVDTFSIQIMNRDPFLGTIKQKQNTTTNRNTTTSPQLQWPQLSYGGVIKKQNTTTQVFVVNINNNQYLLKKGQSVDEVTLLNGNSKEIVVRYKSYNKTIALQ